MATTPEGTPYVESSDLVANYPAASLALANRVDLVGVLPFATATARNTAIPSPTDGQYVYLQDTNTTQFYNGAAWRKASDFTLIAETTVATQTSVIISNCFTSQYANYRIIASLDASSLANLSILYKLRAGGSTVATNYKSVLFTPAGTDWTSGATALVTGTTAFIGNYRAATTTQSYSTVDILGPQQAKTTQLHGFYGGTSAGNAGTLNGVQTDTTQFDSLVWEAAAGTFSGTVAIYGYGVI